MAPFFVDVCILFVSIFIFRYKESPMIEFIEKVNMYYTSLLKFDKSPYLYPLYGLGELPQGFARYVLKSK